MLAPASAPASALSSERAASQSFGIAGVQLPWLPPEQQEIEISLAAAAGAKYIGLDFDWRKIEPIRRQYDWAAIDQTITLAKQVDLKLTPMLLYTPDWASSAAFAPLDYHLAPPRHYEDFRDFVYTVVERYKPYGESSLTADGYGITDWVIWNEPNTHLAAEDPNPGNFWTGSLPEYIQLLRAGYEGAHAADPGCNVLNGALTDVFWTEDRSDIVSALERLYDPNGDGDAADGGRPYFDTLNIHLYQLDYPQAQWHRERIENLLAVMQRFGDEQKSIWITESGYGSVAASSTLPQQGKFPYLDETAQADAVSMLYETYLAYPAIERVFWWSLRDYFSNASIRNDAMEAHYGLLHANFAPKPAYLAYAQMTGASSQALKLSALIDDQGVARITLPASFTSQAGRYIVFAGLNAKTLATVLFFQNDLIK